MRRTRARRGTGLLALAVLATCLLQPAAARAADWQAIGQTTQRVADGSYDVLVLRTTGLAVLLVGVGLFIPSVIVTAPGGMTPIRQAWQTFIVEPAEYAIWRPLGDF